MNLLDTSKALVNIIHLNGTYGTFQRSATDVMKLNDNIEMVIVSMD